MKSRGININGKWISGEEIDKLNEADPGVAASVDKAAEAHLSAITDVARDLASKRQALVDSIKDPQLRAFAQLRSR